MIQARGAIIHRMKAAPQNSSYHFGERAKVEPGGRMARDARGAEWGRFRRQTMIYRRTRNKRRTLKVAAVYLLERWDSKLMWFGAPQRVAKVGRSARSPFRRVVELGAHKYEFIACWPVAHADLPRAELAALHAMKSTFGTPCDGREAFYVDAMEHAYAVVEASIASYVTGRARVEHQDDEPGPTGYIAIPPFQQWIGGSGSLDAAPRHDAGHQTPLRRRKALGPCLCEECRKEDPQKILI